MPACWCGAKFGKRRRSRRSRRSRAVPTNDAAAAPLVLEAWEAELYGRCPRRYFYERVLSLPVGEMPPYHTFRHAVRETLKSLAEQDNEDGGDPFEENWTRFGPDPAHPFTPLYREAAREIVGARRAAQRLTVSEESGPPLIAAFDQGEIRVRPDRCCSGEGEQTNAAWECHTFRRPP
jgi:hypothetical protein